MVTYAKAEEKLREDRAPPFPFTNEQRCTSRYRPALRRAWDVLFFRFPARDSCCHVNGTGTGVQAIRKCVGTPSRVCWVATRSFCSFELRSLEI